MEAEKNYTVKEMLELDPLELLDYVINKTKVQIPTELTLEIQAFAAAEMSRAVQFETSLSQIADRADLMKRKMKLAGDKDGAALMQMRENVLKGQAARLKRAYDTISRLFSIKNQELQELKLLGLTS